MNKNTNPYKHFKNFVLRTPLFPFDFYIKLTKDRNISDEDFKRLFEDDIIKESIYLASPTLYKQLDKWSKGQIRDSSKIERIRFSFLKYLTRSSSRCTPFGLFAGCAIGEFGDQTKIQLNKKDLNSRHTRFDMNYLVALSQDLAKNNDIKSKLLFFPNSSIYKIGKNIRYIEYQNFKGARDYHIVSAELTVYLKKVLKISKDGIFIDDLNFKLKNLYAEVSNKDIKLYINELIDSQILVNELEPAVSGVEFLEQLTNVLSRLDIEPNLLKVISEVEESMRIIDLKIGNNPKVYKEISLKLETLKTEFDEKFLFQTDLVLMPKSNTINESIISDLNKILPILNKITLPSTKISNLKKFAQSFLENYEDDEVSLAHVLDVETGISYKQDQTPIGINSLIDDLKLSTNKPQMNVAEVSWSQINSFVQKKIIHAIINKKYIISFSDNDFKEFDSLKENWDDLSDTIFSTVELVSLGGELKIIFPGVAGPTGAMLFGRFCHGDSKLLEYSKEITNFERNAKAEKIVAEIAHLPQSRSGNILMRPKLRDYEIPYLANSLLDIKNQIPINDLTISVQNRDSLLLKSRKLNKEVIPYLTNAHNYSNENSLPIYKFLCDLQFQNKREFIGFNLGPFSHEYEFIPRIEYKNIILSVAKWNLKKNDFIEFYNIQNDDDLVSKIHSFRKEKRIPILFLLVDGDNELLINSNNLTSFKMFLNMITQIDTIKLKEFLYDEDSIVKNTKGEKYTNQVIISFFNSNKLNNEREL